MRRLDHLSWTQPPPMWLVLAAVVPLLTLCARAARSLGPDGELPAVVELRAYAAVLLVASAALYLLQVMRPAARLASWGSALAMAAAIELLLSVLATSGLGTDSGQALSLIMAVALLSYLLMEGFYRDLRAGVFVLPLIACAALLQTWLGANLLLPAAGELLRLHWSLSSAVAAVIGYALLALGAGRALRNLLDWPTAVQRISLRHPGTAGAGMVEVNVAGVLLLAAAAAAWELWAKDLPRQKLFLSPIELWALGVLVAYVGHLLLLQLLQPSLRHTALWAAILFGGSLLMLLGAMAVPWSAARA